MTFLIYYPFTSHCHILYKVPGLLFPRHPLTWIDLIGPSSENCIQYSPAAPLATFFSVSCLRTDICNTTNMSKSTKSEPLPLPRAPTPITDDSELLKIWNSIDGWYSKVKKATDKSTRNIEWRSYGCHILLGCKVMTERLQALAKDQLAKSERSDLGYTMATLQRIREVHNWVETIGAVHEDFRWETKTVLEVAHQKALALYNDVLTQATRTIEPSKLPVSIETIGDCERVLCIVMLYTGPRKGVPGLDRKGAKKRWEFIDSLLQEQQKLAAAKDQSSSEQDPLSSWQQVGSSLTSMATASFDDGLAEPAAKRRRVGDGGFTASQRAVVTPVAPPLFDTAAMIDRLQINEVESHLLALFERTIAVETPGILEPPAVPILEEMTAILRGQWICDRGIVCYLALVCHHANGHFNLPDPCAKQSGSPKYHAWDTLTVDSLRQGKSLGKAWPPQWYPEARLEDVEIQFFPWHITGNHWCLGVLSKVEGSWVLDQYSTLPGYDASMQESWVELGKYLETKSDGAINALTTETRYPSTPQQNNGDDCGPFILCIARWLMEQWPLNHINADDMPAHRRRMAFEIEKWRLS